MQTALVLVDIQNDYFPGGKMVLEGSIEASLQAKRLLAHFRQSRLPVVHIRHLSTRPGATFFLPETDGAMIHENVRPQDEEAVIQKQYPNSFRDTSLLDHLRDRQVRQVVIAGMMTHMCVDATVRAAFDFGFACLIAQDACATRALVHGDRTIPAESVHLSFLAALNGIYGKVLEAAEIVARVQAE